MWHFLIKQRTIDLAQYQDLQKRASLTEVELFNEPYENWYVFTVEKNNYAAFMDHLDRAGVGYDLTVHRPTRDDILNSMR